MSAIINNPTAINAHRPLAAPNEPLKAPERPAAPETVRPAEEADVAVRPRLFDVLQSIKQLASATDPSGLQAGKAEAGASLVREASMADELINLTKSQILKQSGTSALGHSTQSAQSVLSLLK